MVGGRTKDAQNPRNALAHKSSRLIKKNMRAILTIVLLLQLVLAQVPTAPQAPTPDDLATVEGIVRHALTGQPLWKAAITLNRASPTATWAATTTSDANGKFAMNNLSPGSYSWNVQRTASC